MIFFIFLNKSKRGDNRFVFKRPGQVNEFNSFVDKLSFDKMSNMILYSVNIRTKYLLSLTYCQTCCMIK